MNDVLKNLMESLTEQCCISPDVYKIGVIGSCFLCEPVDGFCDDGIFLLEEYTRNIDGIPIYQWYVVFVELGNIKVYDDLPIIFTFEDILKYYLMCCGSYDLLRSVVLYGDNKPYFTFKDCKLELK